MVFHEMTHCLGKRHNESFWKAIAREFDDWATLEKDLLVYWFLVQKSDNG